MRIAVVNNQAPFTWGGAEELAVHLVKNLIIAGHEAQVVRVPFQWNPEQIIPSQMLLARSLDLSAADLVIALKFPAYLIEHPNKVVWLLHQFRQVYDLLEVEGGGFVDSETGRQVAQLVRCADQEALSGARRVFTNSEVTMERLKRFNGLPAEVLLPPLNDAHLFTGGEPGGYVFAGGRVNAIKRQHLLVEAMVHASKTARLIVAGPTDSDGDAYRLHQLVDKHGLADRVKLDLRLLSREEYAQYLNHSSAVAYIPYDEDSLGYVAMEAAQAAKPVITATDSGGILGLVKPNVTGWVSSARPKDLARCLSEASSDSLASADRGSRMREQWNNLGIDWNETIETLTS